MSQHNMNEDDWSSLLGRIEKGDCTPFLGAGASTLGKGADIAKKWSRESSYPLADKDNLVRVAQYLAVRIDPMHPKEKFVRDVLATAPEPDYNAPGEPHGVLADLPFSVYLTTNYDPFMDRALRSRGREPRREFCRWNAALKEIEHAYDPKSGHLLSPDNPLVYHLHGIDEHEESMVLTEDDYMDFLVGIGDVDLLPAKVIQAMSSSLLFIGYGLADWNFRILYRGLIRKQVPSKRRRSITVQLPPETEDESGQRVIIDYLKEYYKKDDIHVWWVNARDFCAELRDRWRARHGR